MNSEQYFTIQGKIEERRIESRLLEERIQEAVALGHTRIRVLACGQHGIGGRLWCAEDKSVHVVIEGPAGQRVGSMGFFNTRIDVLGPCSDDVGWLNAGATIIVHGNAGNGAGNAMAQGKIYVAGNIGSRGMTMTKHNPRFAPPELWVLGSAGDYFGEFMAGGIAVICGYNAQNPDNVLGYRPLVGMVGGKVFFRGSQESYSQSDAMQVPIEDDDWDWFSKSMEQFLLSIEMQELSQKLLKREEWQCLRARRPHERHVSERRSISSFRSDVWGKELGPGGLVGDLCNLDRSPVPLITRGELRRYVPVWENEVYMAPCEAGCPTGMPVQKRWELIRAGRVDEAVDLALAYTPFPATVCGYLCPNLCMESCTKGLNMMKPVDVTLLGKASLKAKTPDLPELSGKRVAVIGGGPAGLSVAWQLRLAGHEAVVFDLAGRLGGKIASAIPGSRIPEDVFEKEIERISDIIPHVYLQRAMTSEDFNSLVLDYDMTVIAAGAQKPRTLPVPGRERAMTALEFLTGAKRGDIEVGEKIVIIGAGNVGCDVASEAFRLGSRKITLLDIQRPASFGKEREAAERAGAVFRWPVSVVGITAGGVELDTGEVIEADTVVISIGDIPDLDFLPEDIVCERGFIKVDENWQTSNPKVFAIGDVVRPGLLTDAIGAGRRAAAAIDAVLRKRQPPADPRKVIDPGRVKLEYFDPRILDYNDLSHCGSECASCGKCRDCGICEAVCPQSAISRLEEEDGFAYLVDENLCIGCGFCAGACPCGIWSLVENAPLDS